MKTNQFNSLLLNLIGCKLNLHANTADKAKYLIINMLIFSYFFYFAFVSSIFFGYENWNNTIEVLFTLFQLSAIVSGMFAYLNLIYRKNLANETFNDIEVIVSEREKLVRNDLYPKMIKTAEMYVKYPIVFFAGSTIINSIVAMIFNAITDIVKGEIHTEKWFLPYRYT